MKRLAMVFFVWMCLLCGLAAADGATALSVGTMMRFEAAPNQKLALRMGPSTKYRELFTVPAANVDEFTICQKETGGSTTWGMVDFYSGYGRYRAYTGMKRIDVEAKYIPSGNKDGVECLIGEEDADLYAGPGKDYVRYDDVAPAGMKITVYHEERGYVLADFMPQQESKKGEDAKMIRAWIAVGDLFEYEAATSAREQASPIYVPGATQAPARTEAVPAVTPQPVTSGGYVDVG